MVDDTLRWILRHDKRVWIVITLTFLTALLFILPAVEEYSAARARMQDAQRKLDEANRQLQGLPQLQQLIAGKKGDVEKLEVKTVTPKEVENLYGTLQQLIRETGCEMRLLNISDPISRPWFTKDSPIRKSPVDPKEKETVFQLVTRMGVLRMEGKMANVHQFLSRINSLDRFLNTKAIRLERSQRNENSTELQMEFELFDLVRKKSA